MPFFFGLRTLVRPQQLPAGVALLQPDTALYPQALQVDAGFASAKDALARLGE
jgi:hypothetical protein